MLKYFFLLFISAAFAVDFQGDVVLRITPKTDTEVQFLKKLSESGKFELDIWRDVTTVGQNVDIHVKASDIDDVKMLLKKHHIIFSNMIDNLQTLINEEKATDQKNAFAGREYFHDSYHGYEEIKQFLYRLISDYNNRPNKVELINVGRTYEGRTMYGVKISAKGNSKRPAVWIDGGIHAREWISPATVLYFAEYMAKTTNNQDVKELLGKYDFYILPVFNVDGYEFTHTGGRNRMWRKTRSKNGWNTRCMGADPNRNWGHQFGGAGTSPNPCSDTYHGKSAFSEVEVKNVANYLKYTIGNVKSYWNVHAYSQLVLTPWSYTRTLPTDYREIERVGLEFANGVRDTYGTSYRVGPPSRILYSVGGGSMDWTYKALGVRYSYALELRDTGRYGFMLPASMIRPSGIETTNGLIRALKAMK